MEFFGFGRLSAFLFRIVAALLSLCGAIILVLSIGPLTKGDFSSALRDATSLFGGLVALIGAFLFLVAHRIRKLIDYHEFKE